MVMNCMMEKNVYSYHLYIDTKIQQQNDKMTKWQNDKKRGTKKIINNVNTKGNVLIYLYGNWEKLEMADYFCWC